MCGDFKPEWLPVPENMTHKWNGPGENCGKSGTDTPSEGRVPALCQLMAPVQERKSKAARYFGFSKEAGKSR